MVAGNLKKVRLQDVIFPQSIIRAHKGPRFGIEDA
jgi:ribulose 1,5-bisphosphate carboxylase large subunit-like protein